MSREFIELDPPERGRVYHFRHDLQQLFISDVRRIHVSESGNHYLEDGNGKKYIVAADSWSHIELDVDEWTF